MLKEQVTFLSSQVTELNRTVRFQERLIDRLLTYLPVSTKEYIPTALVQKTTTTTKSSLCSESSGVVERVDLGLPQDADLEGWRDRLPRTLAEVPPRTVRYADEKDTRRTDYDRRSRDRHETRDRDNSRENQKSHRSRSRNRDPERRRSNTPSGIRIVTIVLLCNQEKTLLSTTPTWLN